MTSEIMERFYCFFMSVTGLSMCNAAMGDDNDVTSNLRYYQKGGGVYVILAFDLGCPTRNMISGSSGEQKAMSHNKVERTIGKVLIGYCDEGDNSFIQLT
jgi:hypothetical protein